MLCFEKILRLRKNHAVFWMEKTKRKETFQIYTKKEKIYSEIYYILKVRRLCIKVPHLVALCVLVHFMVMVTLEILPSILDLQKDLQKKGERKYDIITLKIQPESLFHNFSSMTKALLWTTVST